ncbi:hypothetical protein K443DRAFT_124878 [Laccaria amethystina LaAM-08-1]|uniref:Uncharacterized protein n=1 Tax=Laccaria amethystina LaAM-08-1 TaxID=1095629 RepID=A0A0C9XGR8_9AGAR|nr:hypothetical protein K443DRAFT_124878 [Laccaria amethystina LaAM-08-1]
MPDSEEPSPNCRSLGRSNASTGADPPVPIDLQQGRREHRISGGHSDQLRPSHKSTPFEFELKFVSAATAQGRARPKKNESAGVARPVDRASMVCALSTHDGYKVEFVEWFTVLFVVWGKWPEKINGRKEKTRLFLNPDESRVLTDPRNGQLGWIQKWGDVDVGCVTVNVLEAEPGSVTVNADVAFIQLGYIVESKAVIDGGRGGRRERIANTITRQTTNSDADADNERKVPTSTLPRRVRESERGRKKGKGWNGEGKEKGKREGGEDDRDRGRDDEKEEQEMVLLLGRRPWKVTVKWEGVTPYERRGKEGNSPYTSISTNNHRRRREFLKAALRLIRLDEFNRTEPAGCAVPRQGVWVDASMGWVICGKGSTIVPVPLNGL